MVNTVCFLLGWKILAQGSWNQLDFRLFYWAHMFYSVCVFCKRNFLLKAFGFLTLFNFTWSIELQTVLLRTHSVFVYVQWKVRAGDSWNFKLSKYSRCIGLQIVLLGIHSMHFLFCFVLENSYSRQFGILILLKYSWSIGLQIVLTSIGLQIIL